MYEELMEMLGKDFWKQSRSQGLMDVRKIIIEGFKKDRMPPDTTCHLILFTVQICSTLNTFFH